MLLAMQHASEETVLGDFDNQVFVFNEVTSRFFRRDGKFLVNTDGPDGNLQDFEVKYTFGLTPLQQYLVKFPDGRVQVLATAWDTRPKEAGGQRWFHIYPDESINHQDELHWTGPHQNWNFMCADCHSTNLKKGYSASEDTFETTWSEISVGCEACHGPGRKHLTWAAEAEPDRSKDPQIRADFSIEVCASCHSRRGIIREGFVSDPTFLDHYSPALLTEPLYHSDGQIRDEVYVWGSFTQSRMYSEGVTCTDCHEPHSQQLKLPGDGVCSQCHLPAAYATPNHHHHEPATPGASCLNCHMPETTYMVVDPRRDHSLRIPRPDHSVSFGTPNACVQCHTDRDNQWVANHFSEWYPNPKARFQTWTEAFNEARQGDPSAGPELSALILNPVVPDIARATAVAELQSYLATGNVSVLESALQDQSPLVRTAALRNLDTIAVESRWPLAGPLLADDLLLVRTEAAQVLAGIPSHILSEEESALLEKVLGEYIATQTLNADRVESQINLGNLYSRLGDSGKAERHLRAGIRLDPGFAPAYINLSDLYRAHGMDDQAVKILGEGISANPGEGTLHHALGLTLVRQGNLPMALLALERATNLNDDVARYAYVYGIALNSSGQAGKAIVALETAQTQHPNDRDILFALTTINRDEDNLEAAVKWANKLLVLNPGDQNAQQLLESLSE
jgi:tetratricopeptide (TPR) repeat protein